MIGVGRSEILLNNTLFTGVRANTNTPIPGSRFSEEQEAFMTELLEVGSAHCHPLGILPVSVKRVRAGKNLYPFDPTCGPGYVWHCHILDYGDNEMMRPYTSAGQIS
ncbi:MAG TPA: hypothetical protein VGN34_08165 [Ktedonobacteraceae bacterium]